LSLSFLSNSKTASLGVSLFKPSEEGMDLKENSVYIGKSAVYRIPFFLTPDLLLNPHVAVLGMTGSGKTYFVKSYVIRNRLLCGASIIILDWNGEYDELVHYLDGMVFSAEDEPGRLGDYFQGGVSSINLAAIKNDDKRRRIANSIVDTIIEWIHSAKIGDKKKTIFVLDEAWKLLGSKSNLGQLFREGRKYGLGVVVSTQLAKDVNNEVLANAGTLLVFRLQNAEDYATLMDSGLVPAAYHSNLSDLQVGNCFVRLAYKSEGSLRSSIFIKRVEGVSTSVYNIKGGKMQTKISSNRFFEVTGLVIKDGEIKTKLASFIEANERNLELSALVRFLLKNGLKRADIVTYLRLLGFDDLTIIESYESTKEVLIETVQE
jgi:hypothetical protein